MAQDKVVRPVHRNSATTVTNHQLLAERLLLQVPIYIAVTLGLMLMVTRFILVLRDNLKESPDSWSSVMLLTVLIGSVSVLIVAACAVVGAVIGLVLRACFAKRLRTALTHYSWHYGH